MSEPTVRKVIRDGMVAVLYSPGFGAGWSTWNRDVPECLFAPEIVALVEAKAGKEAIQCEAERLWPDGYWGGARELTVRWLPVGTLFRVDEYDGSESIEVNSDVEWSVA